MKLRGSTAYLFVLLIPFSALAQTQISGKVTFKGNSVKNVNITLVDTYDGATSDENGNYSFETTERGTHQIKFSVTGFAEVEQKVFLEEKPIVMNAELKEKITEINALIITAGMIEASDKKRATAALTPMDVYNTAGANGSMSEGIKFFPGVQKTGESEGLFVRGGTEAETKFFMDGNLVNNYFTASVPGLPGHDRFNTNIFKGSSFSSGGYSALYGQALSAILVLESIDLPERSSAGAFIMPFSVSADFQQLNNSKNASFGAEARYLNFGWMNRLLDLNTDFTRAINSFGFNGNFRVKTKAGGFLKYYGSFQTNSLGITQPSLELTYDEQAPEIREKNNFHNLNFRQKLSEFQLVTGLSATFENKDLSVGIFNLEREAGEVLMNTDGSYLNHKTVLEKKMKGASNWKIGYEFQYADVDYVNTTFYGSTTENSVRNLNSAVFAEINLALSTKFSLSGGLRAENSSYLQKWTIAPRFAAAYKLATSWVTSVAYGQFYQTPDLQYFIPDISQPFQKATHYILQLERNENKRTLRAEVFYKNYENLQKSMTNNFEIIPSETVGSGFAKGFELLWSDKKTIENLNYRISYSFLDSERDHFNYPTRLFPGFASKHNFSVVTSRFIPDWKSGIGLSYQYASPRPYYNIIAQNNTNILLNEGKTKDYNSLNLSFYYLPNLGKTDAKSFTILVAGINNILGFENSFGYRFSQDGLRSTAVLPAFDTMIYIGINFNFGTDKTQQTIDNL